MTLRYKLDDELARSPPPMGSQSTRGSEQLASALDLAFPSPRPWAMQYEGLLVTGGIGWLMAATCGSSGSGVSGTVSEFSVFCGVACPGAGYCCEGCSPASGNGGSTFHILFR